MLRKYTRCIPACLMGIVFSMPVGSIFADDAKPPVAPAGYKMVPVQAGGKITYIKVKDQIDPFKNLKDTTSDGKYHPEQLLNRPSSLANKSFSANDASLSKDATASEERDHQTFITKAYTGSGAPAADSSIPNTGKKYITARATAFDHTSSDFNKSFNASSEDGAQNKTASYATSSSKYQGETSLLANKKSAPTFASSMTNKSFEGPEADAVRHDVKRMNTTLMGIKDLPNRPLTIDEVRGLINHGIQPNTDAPPEPASKPLNDPDYTPAPAPAPSRSDEDKDDKIDLIPSPGTMATPPPENQEALPH